MGPKERTSTVLSALEEAAIVSLRVQARLPLDDVFLALKDVIPICHARACIAACNAMASLGGRRPTAEKLSIVQETHEADVTVSLMARQHGVAPTPLFRWQRLAAQSTLVTTRAQEDFDIGSGNAEKVRVALARNCWDRESIGFVATTEGTKVERAPK